MPPEHDGESVIEAVLEFSEQVDRIGFAWVRDTLVIATNGSAVDASRRRRPSNVGWDLEVAPDSTADVTLLLAAGLALPDGRMLGVGPSATVPGPTANQGSADGSSVVLEWARPRRRTMPCA